MRTTFTTLSALVLATGLQLNAQQQITNGNMEQWNLYTALTVQYYDLGPNSDRSQNFLRTLNEIVDMSVGSAPATTFRDISSHGGVYAARLQTKVATIPVVGPITIPGFIGTGDVDMATQSIKLGRAYTDRPESFTAWYKYAPMNGDSALISIQFTKWDALNQQTVTVGSASQIITGTTSSYTQTNLTINYTSSDAPDTCILIIASSAGIDFSDLFNVQGADSTELFVDDLSFNFPASISTVGDDKVRVFPTLVGDQLNVELIEQINEPVRIRVYDMQGRMVQEVRTFDAQQQINTSSWASGTYTVLVQTDFHPIARVKVVKP